MDKLNTKTLNELMSNPLGRVLLGMFDITDQDLKTLNRTLEEEEAKEAEETMMEKPVEEPVEEPTCGKDYSEEDTEENLNTVELDLEDDEVAVVINKDELEALLKEWEAVEKEVFKLDQEFGINIWDSDQETIYNRYNKMIRMFLESQFGVETADILEDWVFGYDKENRPDFDSVWENVIKG